MWRGPGGSYNLSIRSASRAWKVQNECSGSLRLEALSRILSRFHFTFTCLFRRPWPNTAAYTRPAETCLAVLQAVSPRPHLSFFVCLAATGNDSFVRTGEVGNGGVLFVVVVMHTIETCKFAKQCAVHVLPVRQRVVGNRLIQRHPARGLNGAGTTTVM
jgi:hypothetical protein